MSELRVAVAVACALILGCGSSQAEGTGETNATTDTATDTDGQPKACAAISVPTVDGPGAQQLELVARREQIPGISAQPTTRGQALGVLAAFDGRLHIGYGDYSDNTGPILMSAWDPSVESFVEFGIAPTEEVQRLVRIGDALYCPAIDPDGHQESGGIYRLDCGASEWKVETPIPGAVHVYEVAEQDNTIFACTGSLNDAPALLMASEDRGHTWTEVLRRESPPGRFSRFYYVGATPNLVFVSGRDYPDPGERFAFVRHGDAAFEPITDPPSGSLVAFTLGDELRVVAFAGGTQTSYRIEGTTLIEDQVWPVAPDGSSQLLAWAPQPAADGKPERLLILLEQDDGSVIVERTADLGAGPDAWEPLTSLDVPLTEAGSEDRYISMAWLLGDLYLGTQTGSLWVVRELDQLAP